MSEPVKVLWSNSNPAVFFVMDVGSCICVFNVMMTDGHELVHRVDVSSRRLDGGEADERAEATIISTPPTNHNDGLQIEKIPVLKRHSIAIGYNDGRIDVHLLRFVFILFSMEKRV